MAATPISSFASGRARAGRVERLASHVIPWQGALILSFVLYAALTVHEGAQQDRQAAASHLNYADLGYLDTQLMLVTTGHLGVYLGSFLVFLFWLRAAYRIVTLDRGDHVRFSPGWAIGWFFVPIFNLFRPYQVLRELWWESELLHGPPESAGGQAGVSLAPNPDTTSDEPECVSRSESSPPSDATERYANPPLVGWWWAATLAEMVIGAMGLRAMGAAERGGGYATYIGLTALEAALGVVGAGLTISMVREITRFQTRERTPVATLSSSGAPEINAEGALGVEETAAGGQMDSRAPIVLGTLLLVAMLFFLVLGLWNARP